MGMGIYISVPFCRTKCSYCNFASDVFSKVMFDRYVERVCGDIANAARIAAELGGQIEREVDSIYLGGGTPTVLGAGQLRRIFDAVRAQFEVTGDAEITVECAPGTLAEEMVQTLLNCGVNRVSLGVQSFVDEEAAAVGRLHKRTTVVDDLSRLRAAGIVNINIDLIAGLPHQEAVVEGDDRDGRSACQCVHARSRRRFAAGTRVNCGRHEVSRALCTRRGRCGRFL
jgi:oxygen-independent coproporphyrinogen III oxidase